MRAKNKKCRSGGIGRRAGFGACGRKIVWVQVPSSALFFTLPGMMQKLPGRVFYFCGEDVQTGKKTDESQTV